MSNRPRVLVIEDDALTAELIADFLELEDFDVTSMDSAFGAEGFIRRTQPDAIVLDLLLPFLSAPGLLSRLKRDPATQAIPIIVCASADDTPVPPSAASQTVAILHKPLDLRDLLDALRRATTHPKRRAG
ncbi:MAG TPA: response regulator [Chloroflexota bacterium]|nr:response regulator [Chloroflexota bacterium]